MRKKIGLGIVAIMVAAASAFCVAACSSNSNKGGGKSTYTVTFDANEGAFSDGGLTVTKNVKSGGHVTCDDRPQRADYFFYGWLIEADDTMAVDLSATAIVKDTIYYAGWRDGVNITYRYNYDGAPNGGVYLTDKVARGSLVIEPTKPTREGYALDCWTIDSDGYNKWTFSADKASINVDMYAQWTKKAAEPTLYTVTLHIGDQTETHSVADNAVFVEPENPEKDGEKFVEWRVDSLSGVKYDFASAVTADIHLYAYFEKILPANKHRINYVLDDGKSTAAQNSSSNPTEFTEGSAVTLANPTRESYVFDGWYKDRDFTAKVTTIGTETDNVTLYAKWKYTYPYFVTGDHTTWSKFPFFSALADGTDLKEECAFYPLVTGTGEDRSWDGKSYVAERVYLLASVDIKSTGVKIIGYSRTGTDNTVWYGAQGKTSGDSNIAVTEAGFYTVTIKVLNSSSLEAPTISLRKFTASFVLYNSELIVDDQVVNDGGLITKPVIQGAGAVWYTDPQRTKAWNFDSHQVTGDITLYAEYEVKTYDVVYANIDHLTWESAVTTAAYGQTLDISYNLDIAYANSQISVTVNNEVVNGTTFVVTGLDDVDVIVVNISGNIIMNTYTVSFWLIGDEIHSERVKYGNSVTAPDEQFMIDNDCDFNASEEYIEYWQDMNDRSVKFYPDENSVITIQNVTRDMRLDCSTAANTYTVTFDSKGGSAVASQTKTANAYVDEPADPTRDSYVFKGWYKDKDCTDGNKWNFSKQGGDRVQNDTTLYAKWEPEAGVQKYTVTFLYQKDGNEYKQVDVVASDGIVFAPSTPYRSGYIFDNWYDGATDGEFDFDVAITGNKTLYAVWELDAPSVTLADIAGVYNADGYMLTAVASHAATGVTYSYKWYKDGSLISGATSSTYTVTNVSDSGSYSVDVTAYVGSLVSQSTPANATVSITKAALPSITGVAFKNGDVFSKTVVFAAESTSHAGGYAVTVLNGSNVIFTQNIPINGNKEFTVTDAPTRSCTIQITYYDIDANYEHDINSEYLVFKGNGTAESPFLISLSDHFKFVANHPTAHFEQTAFSVNASAVPALFTSSTPFTGVYDGGNRTISNVSDRNGLFGYIGAGGVVKNIKLTAVAISSGSVNFIGAVASENRGTIENVTVGVKGDNSDSSKIDSNISSSVGAASGDSDVGDYAVGGIVGKNSGTVIGCTNNARLWGNKLVGGIVGYNAEGATVTGCTNNGLIGTNTTTVSTDAFMSYAGGLVGKNGGTLTKSINNGNVTAYKSTGSTSNNNNYYGGLAARNDASGTIGECINNGTVRTDYAAAGLVSRNYGKVEYCINYASVNARYVASNGMATGNGQLLYCVMTGEVKLSNGSNNTGVGGSVKCGGTGSATVQYCYYKSSSDAPSSSATVSDNAVYDVSSQSKIDAMLAVLGNKFVWDGTKITLQFTVG